MSDRRIRVEDLGVRIGEAEILREVNRLRSELIANVSHELRTPLGLIEVCCTSLLMDDVDFDQDTQRSFLVGIRDETERLKAIVDNLLNLVTDVNVEIFRGNRTDLYQDLTLPPLTRLDPDTGYDRGDFFQFY